MAEYKERLGIFEFSEVFPYVVFDEDLPSELVPRNCQWKMPPEFYDLVEREFRGYKVNMYSTGYQMFARKGVECTSCKIIGEYLALERYTNRQGVPKTLRCHFSLYAVKDGQEILMTQDHIVPKCEGGPTRLENLQTMCTYCNNAKGYATGTYLQF